MGLPKRILRISVNGITFVQTDTASIILHSTHSVLTTKVDFDRLQAEIESSDTASEPSSAWFSIGQIGGPFVATGFWPAIDVPETVP
jgi:hypothetical protein